MEELVAISAHSGNYFMCEFLIATFQKAHMKLMVTDTKHAMEVVTLGERRVELLGKLQRFRDQADEMYTIATTFLAVKSLSYAELYFQRARDVGAAHGFFSVEGKACTGLGEMKVRDGRHAEGVDLLRNAMVAFTLDDDEDGELNAMNYLIDALFKTEGLEEVGTLLPRLRAAAAASSRREGSLCEAELACLLFSSRLHEVPSTCPQSGSKSPS